MIADPLTKPLGHIDFARKTATFLAEVTADHREQQAAQHTDVFDDDTDNDAALTENDNDTDDREESGHVLHSTTHSLEGEC